MTHEEQAIILVESVLANFGLSKSGLDGCVGSSEFDEMKAYTTRSIAHSLATPTNESPAPQADEPCNGCGDSGYPCPYCAAPQPPAEGLRETLTYARNTLCCVLDSSPAVRRSRDEAIVRIDAALASTSLTAGPDVIIPGSEDMDKRFAWLEAKAIDMGYRLVPEPAHPDSPHAEPPYAWAVERPGDVTFPRLLRTEADADVLVRYVNVSPPAIKRALYAAPATLIEQSGQKRRER